MSPSRRSSTAWCIPEIGKCIWPNRIFTGPRTLVGKPELIQNKITMNMEMRDTNNHGALDVTRLPICHLTHREQQVLDLLLKGLSNQQIADGLGVKFYTVTTYLKSIYKKLGVHKRMDAAVKVLSHGIRSGSIEGGFSLAARGQLHGLPVQPSPLTMPAATAGLK